MVPLLEVRLAHPDPKHGDPVRDAAVDFMDPNDDLMVVDVTADPAAWQGLSQEVTNWIGSTL